MLPPGTPGAPPLPPGYAPSPPGYTPGGGGFPESPYAPQLQQQQARFAPKHRQRRTPEMLGYKPIDMFGTILVALFAIWMPLAIYMVTLALKERNLIHKYGLNPDDHPFAERQWLNDKLGMANALFAVMLLVTGIMFLLWFARAYGNLPTISRGPTARGTGFATVCWVIPFLNLVRPYHFLKEIWQRTEPLDARSSSPLTLIIVYWFSYAGATVLRFLIGQSLVGSVDDQKFGADLLVFDRVVFVAACALGGLVVYKITRRMTHRCADVTEAVYQAPAY